MAGLAGLFAFLAIAAMTVACLTGSAAALVFGLVDTTIALVAFCRWAWAL